MFLSEVDKVDLVDMAESPITTTIRVKEQTKRRLESLGTMGDTFDSLINRMIDEWAERGGKAGKSGLKSLMTGPRDAPKIPTRGPSVEEAVEVLSKPTRDDVLRVLKNG
jgi:hypothetical protein